MPSKKDEAEQAEQKAYAESLQKQIDEIIHPSEALPEEAPQTLRDFSEQLARDAQKGPPTKTPKRKRKRKKSKP